MEEEIKKIDKKENDIIYSKAIKAGKRIYYLDVKKSRNNDMFLAITESKKKIVGTDSDAQVHYEKHKIFLYKEDFDKFIEGLEDVIGFIKAENIVHTESPSCKSAEGNPDTQAEEPEERKGFFNKFKF